MAAFSIPLSGLASFNDELSVISNNLANLDTFGYKDQRVDFSSIFNSMQGMSGNGDPIQLGNGVMINGTTSNFSNGNIDGTGVASNMALEGNGFFVVQGNGATSYTRDGDFTTNAQGQLCTPDGQLVMGYPATNGVVSATGAVQPITVDQAGTIPASATTSFDMTTNLNSGAAVGTSFSTPMTVYDSLGNSHTLTVDFTNTGTNAWSYKVTLPAADTGGTGSPTTVTTGTLQFNSSGQLTSPSGNISGISIPGLSDGAATMNLTWNLTGSGGASTLTQEAAASATSASSQNGFAAGTLQGYSILPDGTVQGQYSNNQTLALGQVAVASFNNNQGLIQTGNGEYLASFASGGAVLGQAGVGGNGAIAGGAVEASNVDLSTEFANMIMAQQGYEANSKVLTTMNQVSQEILQVIQ